MSDYSYRDGSVTKDGFAMGPSSIVRELNQGENNKQELMRLEDICENLCLCPRCLIKDTKCVCGEGE